MKLGGELGVGMAENVVTFGNFSGSIGSTDD